MPWIRSARGKRLSVQILALFLSLFLGIQVISTGLQRFYISRNVSHQIDVHLSFGQQVLRQLLAQRQDRLTESLRVLATDFGFRAAIASHDPVTIESALDNHADRLQADLALLYDPNGRLIAKAGDMAAALPHLDLPLADMLGQGGQAFAGRTMVLQGRVHQLIVVPVRAPQVIGWIVMGVPLSQEVVADMRRLTGLSLTLLYPDAGRWRAVMSDAQAVGQAALVADVDRRAHARGGNAPGWLDRLSAASHSCGANALAQTPQPGLGWGRGLSAWLPKLWRSDADLQWRSIPLTPEGSQMVLAVLAQTVDEAMSPYESLLWSGLVLGACGLLVFGLGGSAMAGHITAPLLQLQQSAQSLTRGDYSSQVRVASNDEIGALAHSFEAMRLAVSEREGHIRALAYQDALTGLSNRMSLADALAEALRLRDESPDGKSVAVLMLDLDRFKRVNNSLGYEAGDRLLQLVAARLERLVLRRQGCLARMEGNTFGVLLPASIADERAAVAQELIASFEHAFVIDGHAINLSCSVGTVLAPQDGHEAMGLLRRCAVALQRAKSHRSGVMAFRADMDIQSKEALSLLGDLRQALIKQEFVVYIQPKVSMKNGRVTGGEALIRWAHPSRGLVPPMQFIPFAEETGFVRQMTAWMLEEAAKICQAWHAQGQALTLAVNLSTRDLMDHAVAERIEALIANAGLRPSMLKLEITESSIMDDPVQGRQVLDRLHGLGLQLSIDDFGTGYSSLAYLKDLPVDELKIDRSFVIQMHRDNQSASIVRSVIDLAHNLNLEVVAEGIEDERCWSSLREWGCDVGQGYWMAKPMPVADFMGWMKPWRLPESAPAALSI